MEISTALEREYNYLTAATKIISQRYDNNQIDLDDTIEELRPIRMRMYAISSKLKVLKDEVRE